MDRPSANGNRRSALVVGVAVVLLTVIIGAGFAIQSHRDTTGEAGDQPGTQSTTTGGTSGTADLQVEAADTFGLGVGDPDAPVKVEVFEDFLCPFCREYEAGSHEQLRKDAADGKVYLVYRPIAFLNEYSARSLNAFAVVLNESGPGVALAFHDRLYENQPAESATMPDNAWLIKQAVAAGADAADITKGISKLVYRQWVINGADDASQRKVNGTPTVFADGTAITGVTSIEDLVSATEQRIDAGQ